LVIITTLFHYSFITGYRNILRSMCNQLTLIFGCRHAKAKIWPCSKATLCRSAYNNGSVTHPGECPDCLGGQSWPIATFDFAEDLRKTEKTNYDYCLQYAQSWVDWVVLLLGTRYEDFIDDDSDGPMSYDEVAADVMRTMYRETICRECDKAHQFGKPCGSCPSMKPVTSILGNPVINYRREVAEKKCESYYGAQLDNWEQEQVREIVKGEPIWTHHAKNGTLVHRALPVPPADVKKCVEKHFGILRQIMEDVVTGGLDRPDHGQDGLHRKHEAYTICAGLILNLIMCLMAFDTGLKAYYMQDIMNLLSHMLVHPKDHRNPLPTVPDELDLQCFQRALLCYTRNFQHPTQVMKELFTAVEFEFEFIRTKHRLAIAKTVPRPKDIMRARLRLHTTEGLHCDDDCPICLNPMDDRTEQVATLKCNHQFHFECVLEHMSEASAGRNTCAICRASIDGKPKDDKAIYGINWSEAWMHEVDLLKWPVLQDTLAGLGWEREEVKPAGGKNRRLWGKH
jgi:hypothetical protein